MTVQVGDRIPSVTLPEKVAGQVDAVDIAGKISGKKAVLFGMPGAYTPTCSGAHMPSIVAEADAFRAKGVEEIIVFVANDVHVTEHWGETSGATAAGISILADWKSELTKALGLAFTVPAIGFQDRTVRCAMYCEDGVVKVLQLEEQTGACDLTTGTSLLDAI